MGIVKLHDPQANLDYGFDWVDYLNAGETIASSTWRSNSTSLTLGTQTNTTRLTQVFATGGTVGSIVRLINEITTDSSPARVDERVVVLRVAQR